MTKRDDSERDREPLPRDPQDQQATGDHDPLAVPLPGRHHQDEELPDTDEAGSGPTSGRSTGTVHPEHPEPDEPTG
ncbi:hypothetical protein ACSMX9_27220 [Streptomyces sp. LE64]|uniref:hypothetical protein n=1 Tax=Streptomyces sp. LE64 TaxID=3448653 RepID=UPI0040422E7E